MSEQPTGDGRPDPVDGDAPVLPTQTGDDTDAGWGERWRDEPDSDDERYLRERPPHWE